MACVVLHGRRRRPAGLDGALSLFVESPVDLGNLSDPPLALAVLQRQDLLVRPVKVKCDIRYLLIEPL
jgi:hypothetical protein